MVQDRLGTKDFQNSQKRTLIAIAWCLAWGAGKEPQTGITVELLHQMRTAILNNQSPPAEVARFIELANQLQSISENYFPETLAQLKVDHSELWQEQSKIGLVYGGATKIKQYVFEAAKLSDIRGASALLDRINLADIPGFFEHQDGSVEVLNWLNEHFYGLRDALIPELLIYFKGGSILTFCPVAYVNQLCDAIEKRYTYETLTANSCAVGDTFKLLEIRFGLLKNPISNTLWFDSIHNHRDNPAVQTYFDITKDSDSGAIRTAFQNRKSFNELVGKLATQFNQRRSGFDIEQSEEVSEAEKCDRLSRRYPPMFETHPYLVRDDSDRRSAVVKVDADQIPGESTFSEPLARKRRVGQIAKQESAAERKWYEDAKFEWDTGKISSWINRFEQFLRDKKLVNHYDPQLKIFDIDEQIREPDKREARSLREISDSSDGFVAYIYADGNNMGQHIRDKIKTPSDYQQFSEDIFQATTDATYYALSEHLNPHEYTPDAQSNRKSKRTVGIHPFEIVTIGGDDVLLIVPANKALAIAKTIGEQFEAFLEKTGRYPLKQLPDPKTASGWHRYQGKTAQTRNSCLSISSGVLITADNTPIYYADKLVSQLLKSAKKKAKSLEGYAGGTVDILTLKAVTMISSNISAFRQEGLTIERKDSKTNHNQVLKLYATPYTLHELGGLLETLRSLKDSNFPLSQLYQIRSLLERGKRTSILNYRYFRVRLGEDKQKILKEQFENSWCEPETNDGNLAPWLTPKREAKKTTYQTIWRELVELLPFMDEENGTSPAQQTKTTGKGAER
jgi:CRISPR-associated protein Cmr2